MIMTGLARIGRDVELDHLSSGLAVCKVSLAFNVGFGDRRTTTWVEASLWGKQAEALSPYLLKGTAIVAYLKDIKLDEYTKRDGTHGAKLIGTLTDIDFAGGKKEEGGSQPKPQPKPQPQNFEDFDDDIPF
jgi:single-strand DNA-binding protein